MHSRVHIPMVNSTSYPSGTANEWQFTKGDAAELKESGANEATAAYCSFPAAI